MARQEQHREDLIREATALAERVELQLPGRDENWVIGFRANGAASLFLGQDLVFQFNASDELRRAYFRGWLVKAERGRLIWLRRERTETQVHLLRREFTVDETDDLLKVLRDSVEELRERLKAATCRVVGQVPAEADLLGRTRQWLAALPAPIPIADSPGVAGH